MTILDGLSQHFGGRMQVGTRLDVFLPWFLFYSWYTFDVLPVDASDVGAELAKLVGSAEKLAKHAEKIMTEGGDEKIRYCT